MWFKVRDRASQSDRSCDQPHCMKQGEEITDHEEQRELITERTALVFLLGTLSGAGAASLTYFARHSGFDAVLVGIGTVAVAIKFFDWLIRR